MMVIKIKLKIKKLIEFYEKLIIFYENKKNKNKIK